MSEGIRAWILERIADDERVARDEVEERARWRTEYEAAGPIGIVVNPFNEPGAPGDPARVLAECDAKRRLVDLHQLSHHGNSCYDCGTYDTPCLIHLALATAWADDPGYLDEWRPDDG